MGVPRRPNRLPASKCPLTASMDSPYSASERAAPDSMPVRHGPADSRSGIRTSIGFLGVLSAAWALPHGIHDDGYEQTEHCEQERREGERARGRENSFSHSPLAINIGAISGQVIPNPSTSPCEPKMRKPDSRRLSDHHSVHRNQRSASPQQHRRDSFRHRSCAICAFL